MNDAVEVRVPDIGDFKEVPIIDIFVKPGDRVNIDDPLVAIESDKASMDVPAPAAGVVGNVQVKVGDKVSQGSVILTLAEPGVNGVKNGHMERGRHEAPAEQETAQADPAVPATQGTLELRVPDIGEFKDVPVIELLVKVGDTVAVGTSLITIESDKASMEVPSPLAGVIQGLSIKVGDHVSQGSLIGMLTSAGVVGRTEGEERAGRAEDATAAGVEERLQPEPRPTTAPSVSTPGSVVHASPAVRRLAREFGVALDKVRGTASHGRITKQDLQSYVKQALQGLPAVAPAPPASGGGDLHLLPWPKVDFAKFGPVEVKPLSRIKKISGANLHRNWVMIPHVTNNEEADITDLEAFRKDVNDEQGKSGVKLTMLAFLIKAVVYTLAKFPEFNASLDGEDLVLKQYYHIGFAADTPNGLVVPIVREADKKGVLTIAQETRDLAAKAREGKLTSTEMQGGTFTISSLGGIGGTTFTPIINAPEVAILGVCRSVTRPVWDGKQFGPRLMLPLSLSYDHRVIDGASAARFNAHLAGVLADMRRVML